MKNKVDIISEPTRRKSQIFSKRAGIIDSEIFIRPSVITILNYQIKKTDGEYKKDEEIKIEEIKKENVFKQIQQNNKVNIFVGPTITESTSRKEKIKIYEGPMCNSFIVRLKNLTDTSENLNNANAYIQKQDCKKEKRIFVSSDIRLFPNNKIKKKLSKSVISTTSFCMKNFRSNTDGQVSINTSKNNIVTDKSSLYN
jgi:hypothetical protein